MEQVAGLIGRGGCQAVGTVAVQVAPPAWSRNPNMWPRRSPRSLPAHVDGHQDRIGSDPYASAGARGVMPTSTSTPSAPGAPPGGGRACSRAPSSLPDRWVRQGCSDRDAVGSAVVHAPPNRQNHPGPVAGRFRERDRPPAPPRAPTRRRAGCGWRDPASAWHCVALPPRVPWTLGSASTTSGSATPACPSPWAVALQPPRPGCVTRPSSTRVPAANRRHRPLSVAAPSPAAIPRLSDGRRGRRPQRHVSPPRRRLKRPLRRRLSEGSGITPA